MSPQRYQYQFWTDFEDMQKIPKIRFFFGHETQSFINIAPSCTREKPNIMTCSTFPSATWR